MKKYMEHLESIIQKNQLEQKQQAKETLMEIKEKEMYNEIIC